MLQAHVSGCQVGGGSQFAGRTHRGRDKGGPSFLRDEARANAPAPGRGLLTDSEPMGRGAAPQGPSVGSPRAVESDGCRSLPDSIYGPRQMEFLVLSFTGSKTRGNHPEALQKCWLWAPRSSGARWGLEPLSF